ncbi:MAG: protein kinase, partial [Chloroflexota bacterium]|nr:protein kinase [Chloroflexota bacterium]
MTLENKDILEPGTVLFGYCVIEFVGKGNWSYVYKAQHPKLPMCMAIKQLKPEWAKDEDALQRFLREADIVAQLNHPNVVTIYSLEYDEKTDSHHIITEFADKGTLADRLEKSPEGLPIDEVLYLAMDICSGLKAVHRKGIVHRDIKPSNILLCDVGASRDVPKLSDFGIARVPAIAGMVVPSSSRMYGSLYYMSPEHLDEDIEVDHRSDLYSLGVLLYELLIGRVPFTGEDQDVFWAHMYVSPTPPRKLRPDIPEALEQIVLQALRKDREGRYQSAADIHEALQAIQDTSVQRERRLRFETLLTQGLEHLAKEEWEAANESLRQADTLEPGNTQVLAGLRKARKQQNLKRLYELGVQYLQVGNWEEAREYLAQVIGHDPDYADGQAKEQLEQTTQELRRERNRRDLMVQYRRGIGYFRKYQWSQAIVELERVIAQDPEFENAAAWLAEAQQYLRAGQLFEKAQHCGEQGEWEEAVDLLEEVARLSPPHIDVDKELENARREWAKVRAEQLLAVWYSEGITQLTDGMLDQAKESFQKIYERRPGYRDVEARLNEIERAFNLDQLFVQASQHEADGEWNQAADVYREILVADPYNRKAVRRLNRALERVEWGDRQPLRRVAVKVQDRWDDRSRRAKVVLMGLFVIIILTLCAGAALAAGIWPPSPTLTPTPTSTELTQRAIAISRSTTPTLATSTSTPALTLTNTPTPTETSTPSPTSTPTSTATPTITPTPTPTFTPTVPPTYTPVPTQTPTPTLAAPILIFPENDHSFEGVAALMWKWSGELGDDDYFSIRAHHDLSAPPADWCFHLQVP